MDLSFSRAPRLVFATALLLSSCALALGSRHVVSPHRVAFNEAEFARYRGAGSGRVAGQLGASVEGKTRMWAGTELTLIPVTSYTKEMVDREIGDGEELSKSDPRLKEFVHLTKTDDRGNFVFDRIPPGQYFVSGEPEWYDAFDFYYQWVCERVTVGNGETVRVRLSRDPHRPDKPLLVTSPLQ